MAIRSLGTERQFAELRELKLYIYQLLIENKTLWQTFGPHSEVATADPGSNLHVVWTLRKLDRVIPNNRKIINAIEANIHLLKRPDLEAFAAFKVHALAFEANQGRRLDSYPTFPQRFAELFEV